VTDTRSKASSITRRSLLKNSAAGAVVAIADSSLFLKKGLAQTTMKAPKVWMDMTREELDNAYTQSVYAPNISQVTARWGTNSELIRSYIGDPLRLSYGDKSIEAMDVYQTRQTNAPINIFIHGGGLATELSQNIWFPR